MEENTSKVFVGRGANASVDPLLAATSSTEPANTLFIINLCSSIAPIQTAGKTIPGFDSHKLYQVARAEDGRTRHRLRLGFFTSEADAEQALSAVRDNYPTAFVACLSDDDRRFARGYVPNTETTAAWKRPVLVPKPAAVEEPVKAAPVAATPAPAVAKEAPKAAVKQEAAAARPAPVIAKPAAVAAAPAKPAAAQSASETDIELSWDLPELTPPQPSASAPAPQTVAPVYKTDTVIKAPASSPPAEAAKKALAAPAEIQLTLEKEPAPPKPAAAAAPANAPAQPFHVGKGVEIPGSALSLESTAKHPIPAAPVAPPAKPAAAKAAPSVKEASKPAAAKSEPARKPPETKPAAAPVAARAQPPAGDRRVPELDSTQTIRALTSAELNDDSQEKWFSIQLVVSERPVNLDAMPHLDIFEAYSVYSIANAGSGKIVYSLRLGFFREEVSAEAVSGYLRTFFPSPSVIRISAAEQTRFKDAPAPKATAAAQTEGKIIELNHARDRKPTIPTVTMEVTDRSPSGTFNPNATGSFNPNATGSFKPGATGSFKVDASGKHKTLKPAAKSAAHATKRSAPMSKTSATGKHKALVKRSLSEQLLDEAREVQLSESAIRKLPKNDSLLSRLVDKLTK
ncbi:MAG TPA: hypothetical protein PKE27_09985 [Povalibacter sp.]|mgnify:CR=1 FL=1|uniref:hypothetical protein n=1 Tax=Povalibacter sp. TaxID=1962978 RepID=UPI002C0B8E2D|nr:hypothetical protein [Povalibacter sp.]HMN44893.1 hypothetical protein [Povalibacter sp.]